MNGQERRVKINELNQRRGRIFLEVLGLNLFQRLTASIIEI